MVVVTSIPHTINTTWACHGNMVVALQHGIRVAILILSACYQLLMNHVIIIMYAIYTNYISYTNCTGYFQIKKSGSTMCFLQQITVSALEPRVTASNMPKWQMLAWSNQLIMRWSSSTMRVLV